ncbi:src-like-adapter 2 [Nelusetta ayraudi]|uniref:src-like-adapter 2 n=1 Tax=Nelusetta ayraudi TaxID=303726 RepID=UPI003F6F3C9E
MGTCPIRCRSNRTVLENQAEFVTPASQDTVIVSLHDYPAFGETELTMCIGEKLTVSQKDGEFLSVISATTGRESYIHTTYTATVTHKWLFSGISRHKASELLMLPDNHSGSFLIRESETQRDCYSLSVLRRATHSSMDCVKHYRISCLQNSSVYISPGNTFPSLHHLVEHYSDATDGLCCRLTRPCFIKGLDGGSEPWPVPIARRRPSINWKDISRSVIFRRKRSEADDSLVSEGLREAISSYIQMTDGNDFGWDT